MYGNLSRFILVTIVCSAFLGLAPATVSAYADVVFVIDESGSVTSAEFAAMQQYCLDVVAAFDFSGSRAAAFGAVLFCDSDRSVVALGADSVTVVNALTNMEPYDSPIKNSCLYCGLNNARNQLIAYGRSGFPDVVVVLTDGEPNRPIDTAYAKQAAQGEIDVLVALGATVFPVAVGSEYGLEDYLATLGAPVHTLDDPAALVASILATPVGAESWSSVKARIGSSDGE